MNTATGYCDCGVVMAAQCVRCGRPRCAGHYYLGGSRHRWVKTILRMETPGPNTVELDLGVGHYDWIDDFLAGGPGCYWCRFDALLQARGTAIASIDAFVAGPSLDQMSSVIDVARAVGLGEIARLIPALASLASAQPNASVVHVRIEPHPRLTSRIGRITKPITTVISTNNAVAIFPRGVGAPVAGLRGRVKNDSLLVTETGNAFEIRRDFRMPIRSTVVALLNSGGQTPVVTYVPGGNDPLSGHWLVAEAALPVNTQDLVYGAP